MLLRRGSLLLLLLWLAVAHCATLATLYQDKSTQDAEPSVEVPADAAAPDAPAADALAGRMEAEQQQQAESEGTQDAAGDREPQPDITGAQEPLPDTTGAQEPQPDTREDQEPQPDIREDQEPQPDIREDQEPQPDIREDQEPQPDTAGTQEPQPDTREDQEPQPDTAEDQEPQPDTAGAQEPQPDTREDQEPQPDTAGAQEPQPDTREDQEPQPDTREDQEPQPDTAGAQEPQPDTTEDQEPQPDTLIADHEVAAQLTQSSPLATEMTADPSDDPAAPAPAARVRRASAQETLSEEEWSEGQVNAELQMGKAEEESGWGLSGLRSSFQTINGYFDSMVELVGGRNGVCQYRCRYGAVPLPRPDYHLPEPNGCASSLLGLQFDMGIPAVTKCCDQLDLCYDTCGSSKYRCDTKFRWCLKSLCADLKNSLGFVSKVQACESGADALYNTVWTLGCRPYMNSQRAACVCAEEEREEL